jgi:hypothetical protein
VGRRRPHERSRELVADTSEEAVDVEVVILEASPGEASLSVGEQLSEPWEQHVRFGALAEATVLPKALETGLRGESGS